MKNGYKRSLFQGAMGRFVLAALAAVLLSFPRRDAPGRAVPALSLPGTAQTNFSLVLIPDSQYLTAACTNEWEDQMAFIRNNAGALNIKAVIHLGDLVDGANKRQFSAAMQGLDTLRASGIPFILAPGNHDCTGGTGDPLNLTEMTAAGLTPQWFSNYSNFGQGWTMGFQNPADLKGSYMLFTNGNQPYLIIALAWLPNATTLAWASNVCAAYSRVPTIYVQHVFVDSDPAGMRSSWSSPWSVERLGFGEKSRYYTPNQIWEQWISNTPNIFWCASGHTIPYDDNSGVCHGNNVEWLTDRAADGHAVLETLADFQNFQDTMGRNSNFLQVAQFTPNQNLVKVYTAACTPSVPVPSFTRNAAYEFTPFADWAAQGTPWQIASTNADGLVLYLNFDSSPAFKDLSPFAAQIYNSNATVIATELGESLSTSSNLGNGLCIGSNPHLQKLPSNGGAKQELNQFNDLSQITVSLWMKTSNDSGDGPHSPIAMLVSKLASNTDGDWFVDYSHLKGDNRTIRWGVVNDSGSRVTVAGRNASPLNDNAWHHVCCTYDGASAQVYIDGIQVGSAAQSGRIQSSAVPVSLGNGFYNVLTNYQYTGCLDEIKVLNRAWTPAQINQEYSRVKSILAK